MGLPMPTQGQLGACMGALGLHVGSKLDALMGTKRAGNQAGQPEQGCDWVEKSAPQLQLPQFPELPAKFVVPPIPQLLPGWQRLQSLVTKSAAEHAALPQPQPKLHHQACLFWAMSRLHFDEFACHGNEDEHVRRIPIFL